MPDNLGALPPNLVILGGALRDEPEGHRLSSGLPVVRFRLDHPIPGWGEEPEGSRVGTTSVLALLRIAETFPGSLESGARVLIVGHSLGGGEVFADALIPTAL